MKDALIGKDRKAIETSAAKLARSAAARLRARSATEIRGHAAATAEAGLHLAQLSKVLYVGIGFLVVGAIGIALLGGRVAPFLIGLPVMFGLAWSRACSPATACS